MGNNILSYISDDFLSYLILERERETQISKIVFGAKDMHRGYQVMGTKLHPKTKVAQGVLAKESKLLIQGFFEKKRS